MPKVGTKHLITTSYMKPEGLPSLVYGKVWELLHPWQCLQRYFIALLNITMPLVCTKTLFGAAVSALLTIVWRPSGKANVGYFAGKEINFQIHPLTRVWTLRNW